MLPAFAFIYVSLHFHDALPRLSAASPLNTNIIIILTKAHLWLLHLLAEWPLCMSPYFLLSRVNVQF